jgi:WD40 repeat protein
MLALVNGHGEVQLWDTASLEVVATLSTETGWYANSVVFSPDGTLLAGAGGWTDCNGWEVSCSPDDTQGVIQLWDVETTEPVAVLRGDTWNANSTTFSPDGSLLVSGSDDGKLQLWDLTTEAVLFEVELPRGGVSSVAFSPDGRLFATGGWDGVVHLWGVTTTE